MASSVTENECPVCKDTIKNPSETSACCGKVFCQTCLTQSIAIRPHCPFCRSPLASAVGNGAIRSDSVPRFSIPVLSGNDTVFRAIEPVGSNTQQALNIRLLNHRLRGLLVLSSALNDEVSQVSQDTAGQVSLPVSATLQRRITSRPRRNFLDIEVIPRSTPARRITPSAPVQTPQPLAANPTPVIIPASDDGIDWASEIALMENAQPRQLSGSDTVRTFQCPYCQQGGLDDLELRDHCNDNHLSDPRPVVCPVCVSLPHGNQQYHSRDFIGHLNLRHRYSIEDVTNIHQSDDINMQAAILMSLSKSN